MLALDLTHQAKQAYLKTIITLTISSWCLCKCVLKLTFLRLAYFVMHLHIDINVDKVFTHLTNVMNITSQVECSLSAIDYAKDSNSSEKNLQKKKKSFFSTVELT